jgi:hypothetical protein
VLPPLPPLCCSSCRRCPAALPPRSSLPLSCRRAPANTALLPPRCRRCPRVADSATTLPTVAAPLRPCSRCSASAATALPPLTQPICRRVRAAPDGGKFTAFPPVVRRAPTAVPTAQDVRLDAERWGGSGGGGCRSLRERERRAEVGGSDLSMVFMIYGWLLLPLPPLHGQRQPKNGITTLPRGFLRKVIPNP